MDYLHMLIINMKTWSTFLPVLIAVLFFLDKYLHQNDISVKHFSLDNFSRWGEKILMARGNKLSNVIFKIVHCNSFLLVQNSSL